MPGVNLSERGEKIKEFSTAQALGHLEGILSKKDAILALKPDELDRISAILTATKAAGNGCCTGG
jgi:hypothetical protein